MSAPSESTRTSTSPGTLRTLLGAGVGNTLEWYDWSVYAIFATFFAQQFFVDDGATGALLSTLAVFAVGFIMRPIGGFLFGWLADRRGRRFSMTSSMILMAAGSLLIGVAPTHAQIGIWAAVILVFARLAQGLAHGGEIAASYTYIAEIAPRSRRGLWSTSLYVSVTAGIVLASLIGAAASSLLGTEALESWAWRIPFLIGGLLGLVGLYLRRTLPETEAFTGQKGERAEDAAAATPRQRTIRDLLRGLAQNKRSLARIVGFSLASTVVYYTWAIGLSGFAITTKGVPASGALWATVAANLVFMATLPLWGKLSDRFGRKPIFLTYGVSFVVLSFPLIAALNDSAWRMFGIMVIALFFLGAFVGIMPAYFAELFPTEVRASGIGVPYSLIVAIFGGTAPYILTWLSSHDLVWVFSLYSVVLVLIGVVTTLLSPETKGRVLE
ncbi:major facilitator transporter (plasmid) [Pseudonocardia sp. EC080610-09]|uniref:MFS transporter n=1 Tax=unclassified Pseudonocardia TaxID=2619320 RepID=UPI0007065166|nr:MULTISPECIES: MFS transporter [unclassified Pseudonocardia]ALL79556.1 major facilitator transporter [Pseudonocardia sp. EC080610-09]ALL85490.1 major facilitator transporter [Pseudonocardia sp. EC080619-01]